MTALTTPTQVYFGGWPDIVGGQHEALSRDHLHDADHDHGDRQHRLAAGRRGGLRAAGGTVASTTSGTGVTGITVFTVGLTISTDPIDTQGISLLQSRVSDATGLVAAFQQIAANIQSLRLTQ